MVFSKEHPMQMSEGLSWTVSTDFRLVCLAKAVLLTTIVVLCRHCELKELSHASGEQASKASSDNSRPANQTEILAIFATAIVLACVAVVVVVYITGRGKASQHRTEKTLVTAPGTPAGETAEEEGVFS
mmetsp:Transcript_7578/g.17375  ORF Transcript_7578/g.17375 Transcript_7578/m.17375 type:complete len:129 (+) Transcript_7578:206-592(+)